jgi:hypothetical protein
MFTRRLVALLIDVVVCYFVAIAGCMIPFIGRFLDLQLVTSLAFLSRDCVFGGRGVGKNIMGLQVIDQKSHEPASLRQSVLRNIVLIAPYLAIQLISIILPIFHIGLLESPVMSVFNVICTIYVLIVLPLESYLAYSRPEGLRKGDELAHTTIVESNTDFSHFLPTRIS